MHAATLVLALRLQEHSQLYRPLLHALVLMLMADVQLLLCHAILHRVHARKGIVAADVPRSQKIASIAIQRRVRGSVAHQR